MRKSRVLLAGVAVAAAGAATSAFTASNDFTAVATDVAGYGQVAVTGATVTNIDYTPVARTISKLDSVVFTTDAPTSPTWPAHAWCSSDGGRGRWRHLACTWAPTAPSMRITCDATDDPLIQRLQRRRPHGRLPVTVSERAGRPLGRPARPRTGAFP